MKHKLFEIFFNLIKYSLKIINKILKIFNKNDFYQQLHDEIEKNQLTFRNINNKKVIFFNPSRKCSRRVSTLFDKEPETIHWINSFDKKQKIIFWDIGANIGLYSIYAATKFEEIEVVAFEPSTSNTRVLSRNISLNKLTNKINIFQLALSDTPNIISEFKERNFQEGGSMSTFKENFDEKGNIIENSLIENNYKIFGTSINYLIENNICKTPNYIKCDVDGLEHLILKGADKILSDNNLLEISIEANPKFKKQYEKINEIMKINNFYQATYYIKNTKKNIIDNENYGNLLFKKKINNV